MRRDDDDEFTLLLVVVRRLKNAPMIGRSPSSGTLSTLDSVLRLTSPPMTKLSPSPSSTVVSARRVTMAGTVAPLIVMPRLKSRSLASGATFSAMRFSDRMVGDTVKPMPKGLYSMVVEPNACGTGIGISPPARKLALWPESATRLGSASTRARPFDSIRLRSEKMPLLTDPITRLNAELIGMVDCVLNPAEGLNVTCERDDGENEPKANPPRVRENVKPASFSTVLLNSTTRTSTCTVPGTAMVVLSTTLPPFGGSPPPAAVAALRARANV